MRYYGQFNPPLDKLLYERFFSGLVPACGIGIECGAADGISESSLKFFEESLGWTIYNIECSPPLYALLEKNRPYSKNFNIAFTNDSTQKNFRHAIHPVLGENFGNGSLSHSRQHHQELVELGCKFVDYLVTGKTFSDFVAENKIKEIDVFVLDVEGHELAVIESMRGSKVLPKLMCIENTISSREEIDQKLNQFGYEFVEDLHNNGIYIHSDVVKITKMKRRNRPTVNICSIIKENDRQVKYFLSQINSFYRVNYEVQKIILLGATPLESADDFIPDQSLVYVPISADIDCNESVFDLPRRWAKYGNQLCERSVFESADYTFLCDSELCMPPDTIDLLLEEQADAAVPLIILGQSFYEESKDVGSKSGDLCSVGTCFLIKSEILGRSIRFPGISMQAASVDFLRLVRMHGFSVKYSMSAPVIFPTSHWRSV